MTLGYSTLTGDIGMHVSKEQNVSYRYTIPYVSHLEMRTQESEYFEDDTEAIIITINRSVINNSY
jgi:hypothetical protein